MNGLIKWFAENSVAANLLMLALLAAGLITITTTKTELFPQIQPNVISVSVAWPGATPFEVEEAISVRIEEELDGLQGIKRLTSVAAENVGQVTAEFFDDVDIKEALNDVKTRVDGISTFPPDAERPVVKDSELIAPVLQIAVFGQGSEIALRRLGDSLKDELVSLPEITNVDMVDSRVFEIWIEVSAAALDGFGITFDHVANAVRQGSVNIASGTIRTGAGEIVIRTDRQAYRPEELESIPVITRPDGTRVLIRDVATIRDGFEDNDYITEFDGRNATLINVNRVGNQSVEAVAGAARRFVEQRRASLPEGMSLAVWKDMSRLYEGRRDLLLKNGAAGLILVLAVLALFLKLKLAMWVVVGLATALIGAFWLMPMVGASVNMLSLFGFIVVLGILVDDAVVVAENVYVHRRRFRKKGLKAAQDGATEISLPVLLAVLTTIAAFLPMVTMPGVMGQFARAIPVVVVLALAMSLVESLFILPAHLTNVSPADPPKRHPANPLGWWERVQTSLSNGLEWWVEYAYRPSLNWALRWRYTVVALAFFVLFGTFGMVGAGWIKFHFFPPIEGDNMIAMLDMPAGTPREVTEAHIRRMREAGEALLAEAEAEANADIETRLDQPLLKHSLATVGVQPTKVENSWQTGGGVIGGGHVGEVNIELLPSEIRGEQVRVADLMNRWRERVGVVPDAVELSFKADVSGAAPPIDVQLMSPSMTDLRSAADEVRRYLDEKAGVTDITDTMRAGKRELRLEVLPEAESLGLTRLEVARQIRQAFFGEEIQRVQRGRDDLKIKVRYPEEERERIDSIEHMLIRLPDGSEIPFTTVAAVEPGRGPSTIQRANRQRMVSVRADVNPAADITPTDVNMELASTILPQLMTKYHGMTWSMEGQAAQQAETLGGMGRGTIISMMLIYSLLALAFRSYVQPLIVMSVIPFGMVGALVAHMFLGYQVTLLSLIGLLAMAGVVVNNSLLMIDFTNRARRAGIPAAKAALEAGPRRFRAIVLTSLTTFVGLAPMLFETSVQAKFLIPMAISLAFGVLFSTAITLMLTPALYMVVEDIKNAISRGWNWLYGKPTAEATPAYAGGPTLDQQEIDEMSELIRQTGSRPNVESARHKAVSPSESRRLRLDELERTKSGRLIQIRDENDPLDS